MRGRRALTSAAALAFVAMFATGCGDAEQWKRVGFPEPVTEQGERMLTLWQGSWIAALAVGIVVWGLIGWAVVFHRKRKNSPELPLQVRYNLPIEMLYTAVPFIIIGVLFYYTARDETYVEKLSKQPAVTVDVTGFQWSWQFDYPDFKKADGRPVSVVGTPTSPDAIGGTGQGQKPVLVIPEDRTVRFKLHSNDVIHSFWIPSFIYKKDVMPGYDNEFEVTATKTGTYEGRCAELCGVDHSRMLFQVKVVTQAEFDQFIKTSSGGAQ